jgi:hypothetical protein
MPVASRKPTADPTALKPVLPTIEPKDYQSIVVDDNQLPLNSLITYMEGSPWTVDYYNQVITRDNDIREFDPGQVNIYQQYTKITGLEVRVTTPLTDSQESDSALVSVTGAALIYPFLVPNIGDVFVAEASEGRRGVYRVDNVERKTFNKGSAFSIEYQLVCYVDSDQDYYRNLEDKTTKIFFFDKQRLTAGLAPTLIEKDFKELNNLNILYEELCLFYFRTFFSREYGTLILPGQQYSIYDAFVVQYILKIVNTTDAPEIRHIKNLSIEHEKYLAQNQFWSVLLARDPELLNYCNRQMGLTQVKNFGHDPVFTGLRYTRLDYIVYPIVGDESLTSGYQNPPKLPTAMASVIKTQTSPGNLAALVQDTIVTQNRAIPFINPMLSDDQYVFTAQFYNDGTGQSMLEALTQDYLKGNALSVEVLTKIANRYSKWGRLEQFYYIPILLTLIKTSVRGLY